VENRLIVDLIAVCKVLRDYSVEYLIVGGTAVALHAYFRITTNVIANAFGQETNERWRI